MKQQNIGAAGRRRSVSRDVAYIALAVAVITVCAWLSVLIATVPVTLQTFAVCFIGALFGWKKGLAALGVYILMGLVGIPVFSGFKAGTAALFGPTGGYIFGFFFAVLAPALMKYAPVKNKWGRTGLFYLANIVGLAICYFFGTVWFVCMYRCTVAYALTVCVLPFLLPDAVKLFLAAFLAVRLESHV